MDNLHFANEGTISNCGLPAQGRTHPRLIYCCEFTHMFSHRPMSLYPEIIIWNLRPLAIYHSSRKNIRVIHLFILPANGLNVL